MSGIVGVTDPSEKGRKLVESMLDKVSHRGSAGREIISLDGVTLGVVWTDYQGTLEPSPVSTHSVQDVGCDGRTAQASVVNGKLELIRDRFGLAPLYYGRDSERLCFASEVKALLAVTHDVNILPPGCKFDGNSLISRFAFQVEPLLDDHINNIMAELRCRIEKAVRKCIDRDEIGVLLSGGLDSSVIAVFASREAKLQTFAIGLPDAPDLEAGRQVAEFVGATHHEIIVSLGQIIEILPEVIYYIESFDALLVRSAVINYLVAKEAINYVPTVLVGEGADGLFAGFGRYKATPINKLPKVLAKDIISMHNQGLQRVDRCAMAHGLIAYIPFLDFELADYAICIPPRMKIKDGVEKWILRRTVAAMLPDQIVNRPKTVFWSSGGVRELLSVYANENISLEVFSRERTLPNGWIINTPEELMYYRIFREYFGNAADNPVWVGRTKGAPFIKTS